MGGKKGLYTYRGHLMYIPPPPRPKQMKYTNAFNNTRKIAAHDPKKIFFNARR